MSRKSKVNILISNKKMNYFYDFSKKKFNLVEN